MYGKERSDRELSTTEFFLLRGWDVTPEGCWEYRGTRLVAGYGIVRRGHRAHRVSYEHFVGSIPSGMMVLHSCDNPPCVRPDHLRVGTAKDNMSDAMNRKRARGQYVARTHCGVCGKEYDHPVGKKGGRCASCVRDRQRRYSARKRGRANSGERFLEG